MFGVFKSQLPVSAQEKDWVDKSFLRLASLLGADRMLKARVILPTPEHFPDPYSRSEESLQSMFQRVAEALHVDASNIDLSLFTSGDEATRTLVPFCEGTSNGAGGLYFHNPEEKPRIAVHEKKLNDPMSLVAVLAHEIGHIILLRPGLIARDEPDMEPLNDLLMVFLGFGVFTANAAFQFRQFTNGQTQGWSTQRLGYLSEEILGYALARFACERGEVQPAWAEFLAKNVAVYRKRSSAWLTENHEPRLFPE